MTYEESANLYDTKVLECNKANIAIVQATQKLGKAMDLLELYRQASLVSLKRIAELEPKFNARS